VSGRKEPESDMPGVDSENLSLLVVWLILTLAQIAVALVMACLPGSQPPAPTERWFRWTGRCALVLVLAAMILMVLNVVFCLAPLLAWVLAFLFGALFAGGFVSRDVRADSSLSEPGPRWSARKEQQPASEGFQPAQDEMTERPPESE
jgi:hypothetical protein